MSAPGPQGWVMQSVRYGKTHADTVRFMDPPLDFTKLGGEGWAWLSHLELRSATILHDSTWVYGLQLSWALGDGRVVRGKRNANARPHIPHNRTIVADELTLEEGEFIVHVEMRCGEWVDGLTLRTNRGRELKGGGLGGVLQDCSILPGHRLFGMYGGWGGHLHNIGLLTYRWPLAYELAVRMGVLRAAALVLAGKGRLEGGMEKALKVAMDHIIEAHLPSYWRNRYHKGCAEQEGRIEALLARSVGAAGESAA